MNFTLWLTIAAVSAVTAVILARRKNRSAVIWPVGAFLFPPALLPLFALAPLPERNTRKLDRQFLGVTASLLVLIAGFALIRYGSLNPCDMYRQEEKKYLANVIPDSEQLEKFMQAFYPESRGWLAPQECLAELWNSYTE